MPFRGLRYKLLRLVLLPILIVAPATAGFVVYWSQGYQRDQLLRRVSADLSVAHDVFAQAERSYLGMLERLADSYAFQTAFTEGNGRRLADQLDSMRATSDFDYLRLTDLHGRGLLEPGGNARRSPLHARVASGARGAVGIEVFSAEDLEALAPGQAQARALPLVATPRAAPSERSVEDRLLVIRVLAPVRDVNGVVVSLLDGGVVLNRSFELVDRIRDLVYGAGSLAAGSRGAATVLLDDVRIGTNLSNGPQERALGTRVSAQARREVLERGTVWVARSFEVSDWYVSAYEPLVDTQGRRVGMLSVGFQEAPYVAAHLRTLGWTLLLLLAGTVLAGLYAVRGARRIFRPIEAIASVVRAVRAGEDRRIGPLDTGDEIAELGAQFDETLGLLRARTAEIRRAALDLESRVEARTRELHDKNLHLERTIAELHAARERLVAAEKLAALGALTAGLAHEINNPVAVMQGNLELLRRELGDAARPVCTEIDLVMEQLDRIRHIVDTLLRHSRGAREPSRVRPVEPCKVIADTLKLVAHEVEGAGLVVHARHGATRRVRVDPHELQQVLVNLLQNAVQASPPGQAVEVETRDEGDGVCIVVRDRGVGIPEESLPLVFDAFYTTKRSVGTGLGLTVSFALVQRMGGDIRVQSEPGAGAEFTIRLPAAPEEERRPAAPELFMQSAGEVGRGR